MTEDDSSMKESRSGSLAPFPKVAGNGNFSAGFEGGTKEIGTLNGPGRNIFRARVPKRATTCVIDGTNAMPSHMPVSCDFFQRACLSLHNRSALISI